MRIATWNINGLRARLDFMRLWLEARKPDIIALQELKMSDELFPHQEFAELGYEAAVFGQKAWNGVAILSRGKPSAVVRGLPSQDAMGSRLISADLEKIHVTSLYCPNGKHLEHEDFDRKLGWFDALFEQIVADAARPTIVMGDFNICLGPLDSWNPEGLAGEIFHTDDERVRLQRVLDLGFVDLFRHLHPEAREFSWWDYRGGAFYRGHGLRIDLVLGNDAAVRKLRSAEIDRDWRKKHDGLTASDHVPVVVDLEI